MKKKLAVLLGVLVLSSVSFAAPKPAAGGSSIENSLNNLENQLNKLQQIKHFLATCLKIVCKEDFSPW